MQLRTELGYVDYLGALLRYRLGEVSDQRLLLISSFLVGHYALDRDTIIAYPRADLTVQRIDNLLDYDLPSLVGGANRARDHTARVRRR